MKPFNWPIKHVQFTGMTAPGHHLAADGPKGYGGRCQVCGRWVLRGMGAWWNRHKAPLNWGC